MFFEHVTNLLNMRELEDEGKVMALADYAAPIADEDNPLLRWFEVRDGVIETARPGHALAASRWRAIHWRYANEQFAYLAQRVVEQTCVALARDAVRLTGLAAARARGRRRVEREGDAAHPAAAARSRTSTCFRTWATAGCALGRGGRRRPRSGRRRQSISTCDRLDLGPAYDAAAIEAALAAAGFAAAARGTDLPSRVADLLERAAS